MNKESKIICGIYFLIALVALILCWQQNLYYFTGTNFGLKSFISDLWVTAASRSFTIDIVALGLVCFIWMYREAKKHEIPFVWAYIFFSLTVAISVAFPLFLIAREKIIAQKT